LHILVASSIANVRPGQDDELIVRATLAERAQVTDFVSSLQPPPETGWAYLEDRLEKGFVCYLLYKRTLPASYLWVGRESSYVYDFRLRLQLEPGVGYFFNELTLPQFRHQGLLGKLIRAAWANEQVQRACVCIVDDNPGSLAANQRLGFSKMATVYFKMLGALRIYWVYVPSRERPSRRILVTTPWGKSGGMIVRVDHSGVVSVNQ
jgi:hypothetical protein